MLQSGMTIMTLMSLKQSLTKVSCAVIKYAFIDAILIFMAPPHLSEVKGSICIIFSPKKSKTVKMKEIILICAKRMVEINKTSFFNQLMQKYGLQ
ncbi:MAG: hypothetical protein ACI9LM_000550 [Alteromonadaceae bacterium]|jgi:hypothetical protein